MAATIPSACCSCAPTTAPAARSLRRCCATKAARTSRCSRPARKSPRSTRSPSVSCPISGSTRRAPAASRSRSSWTSASTTSSPLRPGARDVPGVPGLGEHAPLGTRRPVRDRGHGRRIDRCLPANAPRGLHATPAVHRGRPAGRRQAPQRVDGLRALRTTGVGHEATPDGPSRVGNGSGDGAPGGIRTHDPQLRKLVLYPLSYGRPM